MSKAVDPLNLNMICVAMVVEVLQDCYLLIRISNEDAGEDHGRAIKTEDSATFFYHATLACMYRSP